MNGNCIPPSFPVVWNNSSKQAQQKRSKYWPSGKTNDMQCSIGVSTGASIAFGIIVDVDRISVVSAIFFCFFLGQSTSSDDQLLSARFIKYNIANRGITFERLLDIDSFLCTCFEVWNVPLRLAKRHGSFRRDHSFVLFHIDLVSNNNLFENNQLRISQQRTDTRICFSTYKWETLRVTRAGLDEELVTPAVKCLETLRVIHIVDKNTAVGTSIECDA